VTEAGASNDAGVVAPSEPRTLPPPAALPLTEESLLRLGADGAMDVNVALCRRGDGFVIAWDRFDAAFTASKIFSATSRDLRGTTEPAALSLGTEALVANPSCVGNHMYFTRAAALGGRAAIVRVPVGATATEAVSVAEVSSTLSWPRFAAWGARTIVAFRDRDSAPKLAISEDGLGFGAAVAVGPPGALANAAGLGGGALLFSYQRGVDVRPMVSFFRISSDGVTFTPEAPVTASSPNVHDTSALPRADGGVDLYYIYPTGRTGFTLFRRAVSAAGDLGAEEMVTTPGLGEPSKPVAARAGDGTVLLAYADIVARDTKTGEPIRQVLTVARLQRDAQAP